MDHKTHILFGLDRALIDPKEGITKSVCYAPSHYGIQAENLGSLCPFIGPSLTDNYKKFYGFSNEQAWEGAFIYRGYSSEQGWYESREYPGIGEMLQALGDAGRILLVAISKPEEFIVKVFEHSKLAEHFNSIGGASLDEIRCRKGDMTRYVLGFSDLGLQKETVDNVVMIGDREHDVSGARGCDMGCIGVLYGYESRREMEDRQAVYVVGAVLELEQFLLPL